MSTLPRLCAAVLGGLLLVALSPSSAVSGTAPAAQCGCKGTVTTHVTQANAVFTGRVTKNTRLSGDSRSGRSRTSTIEVQRVYKGEIASETVEVVTSGRFATCAEPLREEGRYVFFVEANEGYTAQDCGGTARAAQKLVRQVEGLLGSGRAPVPGEADAANFTPVSDTDPPTLTRVAAPGLALVLVGLLGLVFARRGSR